MAAGGARSLWGEPVRSELRWSNRMCGGGPIGAALWPRQRAGRCALPLPLLAFKTSRHSQAAALLQPAAACLILLPHTPRHVPPSSSRAVYTACQGP